VLSGCVVCCQVLSVYCQTVLCFVRKCCVLPGRLRLWGSFVYFQVGFVLSGSVVCCQVFLCGVR